MTYLSLIHNEHLKQYPGVFKWNGSTYKNNENSLVIFLLVLDLISVIQLFLGFKKYVVKEVHSPCRKYGK